ncbi:MAG TPA: hypothetical protein VHU79_04575 [Sphingomicrobium sp.]|nr:hypothetical protein [Sphingomicrobium sp.]
MRKLILLCAAGTMATAMPAALRADPPGRGSAADARAFCEYQISLNPSLTLGECMSYLLSGEEGYLTQYCQYLENIGELQTEGLSFSECVRYFHQGD